MKQLIIIVVVDNSTQKKVFTAFRKKKKCGIMCVCVCLQSCAKIKSIIIQGIIDIYVSVSVKSNGWKMEQVEK